MSRSLMGPLRARRSWLVALVVLILDQASKHWASHALPPGAIQPLLPGLLQMQRVSNTGAAFSLLSGSTTALALVSAVAALVLAGWLILRPPAGAWLSLAAGLLLGGTLGNGIDRWRLGSVVDFLELVPVRFPIFNIADVAINLAVLCILIDVWRGPRSGDA